MKTEKTIQIIGRWVPEPMIPAEQIDAADLDRVLSSVRLLELMRNDLTVFDGQNSYPRLRLVKYQYPWLLCGNVIAWRLTFVRKGAPWCQPLVFYCPGSVTKNGELLKGKPCIKELIVGYPIYPPAKWVVSTEDVA
ncbi:MAG: hypothetical protein QG642_57 [Patescibacteria group bacterium]|nr:hypothetical protein [Patescibacteria group bacterium]